MNDRSGEAFAAVAGKVPSQREQILAAFLARGFQGACGEEITRTLFGPKSDNTGTARMAELKGIPLGESIGLVRTGATRTTEQNQEADVFIHVAFASDTQIEKHIAWVMDEREKRLADHEAWIVKCRQAPAPGVDLEVCAQRKIKYE